MVVQTDKIMTGRKEVITLVYMGRHLSDALICADKIDIFHVVKNYFTMLL